jgi:tight adherence protein B
MDVNTIIYIGAAVAGLFLVIGIVITLTGEQALVEQRLGRYVEEEKVAGGLRGPQVMPVTDWLNKRVEKSDWGSTISKELARADLKLKPGEYIAVMVIAAVLLGFVAWFLGGKYVIVGALGAVVGLFLPRMYVRREQRRRLIRFNEQLGDMLNLMVNGLRAGYSTMQAMEAVSKELPAPICDEFRRVVQEIALGLPMERSLENLLRRIPSEDLDLIITAINVQREVGGNLAEILETISYTIRERVRIKGEIRVLTAQVMISGKILSFMPVAVMIIIWLVNRDYMMEFFKPEAGVCGYISLAVGAIMTLIGYFVMGKIADIEV